MSSLKRHSLVLFFVLAYLFSWIVWSTSIAQANGSLSFHVPDAFAFIGLSLAAVIAALVSGGGAAFMDLIRRWVRWQVNPLWYAVALLLTLVLGGIAVAAYQALGNAHQIGVDATLPQTLSYVVFHFFLFLVTEETAWRGFALPRLQRRFSPLNASLILGVLWGAWHIPLFLTPGSFQSTIPFVGFMVSAVATSILHTWIFNRSKGSLLPQALFHAVTDGMIVYLGVMTGGSTLFWLFVGVQVVAAVLVTALASKAFLARQAVPESAVYAA